MKYLHKNGPHTWILDSRLAPEVRAMLCAMASRMPAGGILQRYTEVVQAVQEEFPGDTTEDAEERLCSYPLPKRAQKFFDVFVGMYGHSSVMELVGSPAIFVEGVSWWTAYKLFDNPQVAGQEFSTRAVQHKDWPLCMEAQGDSLLEDLHSRWLRLFEVEVQAWQAKLEDPEERAKLGIADKEPFRPALDRARWAIPGTIATGCSQTANLRTMARVLREGATSSAGNPQSESLWGEIKDAYRTALPGMGGMGLRESVHGDTQPLPGHIQIIQVPSPESEVFCKVHFIGDPDPLAYSREPGKRTYIDPSFNHACRVDVHIQCSLAVARDWHRHRTLYPWRMALLDAPHIHRRYRPLSDLGAQILPELMKDSQEGYQRFMSQGVPEKAMLCLPLGTDVELSASGGLRDVLYMFELRAYAHGANFEYREQAEDALVQLREQIEAHGHLTGQNFAPYLGWT